MQSLKPNEFRDQLVFIVEFVSVSVYLWLNNSNHCHTHPIDTPGTVQGSIGWQKSTWNTLVVVVF